MLNWLTGNPRRFKTYVGNRISFIIDQISPERWRHVPGTQNPADCASRGLFPLQLKDHNLWWHGPDWLRSDARLWPKQTISVPEPIDVEEREIFNATTVTSDESNQPIIPADRFSSFTHLKRVTAWNFRFINNTRSSLSNRSHLTASELNTAENYWLMVSQRESFPKEVEAAKKMQPLAKNSKLQPFRPLWDADNSVLRVGGRMTNSSLSCSQSHPVILDGKHLLTKLIIRADHLRLMHAGPTLLLSSLNQRFHVVGARRTVRSITRRCITCRRLTVEPQDQLLGQLPTERVTPAPPFEKTGVDYAGPFQIKHYICLFVCLAVKAVHLELVSNLTTEAFVAALRRFVARRGCPTLIWSDHGRTSYPVRRHKV